MLAKPRAFLVSVIFQFWAGRKWQNIFFSWTKIVLGVYHPCLTQLHLTALRWSWKSEDNFYLVSRVPRVGAGRSHSHWVPHYGYREKSNFSSSMPMVLTSLVTTQVVECGFRVGEGTSPIWQSNSSAADSAGLISAVPLSVWWWHQISQAEDLIPKTTSSRCQTSPNLHNLIMDYTLEMPGLFRFY